MSERLKFSQFNITIPLPKGSPLIKGGRGVVRGVVTNDNVLLVYNTLTRALVSLSKELYETLENLSIPINPSLCFQAGPELLAYAETLEKQGILVSASEDESQKAQRWYDKIRFDKSCMRLSVLTTYNCNFNCVYCIEDGVKKPVQMDDAYSSLTLDWIKNRAISQGVSNLFVLFYGGEPLLNTKPIYYLAENLYRFTQERSIAFRFAITTNGYLLTEEIIERLLPYGLSSVKVTLDGDKEAHDKKRPHISGKGTFEKITRNLLSVAPKVKVNLSANVDAENIDSLPLLMDFLEETHLKELIHTIDLNPIMPTMAGDVSSHTCAKSEPGARSHPEHRGDANILSHILKLKEQMVARGFPVANKLKHVMCGMKQDGGLLVIDPVGQIYTCPAFVGRDEFAVGSLEGQELSGIHKEIVSKPIEQNCLKCAYFPMCSGGCPYDAYIKTGDCCHTVCNRETLEQWIESLIRLQYAKSNG